MVTGFWRAVESADTRELREILAPGWQIVRGDGSHANRAEYLDEALPDVDQFEISGVDATRSNDIYVIRYQVSSDLRLNGTVYDQAPTPCLSTFALIDGKWRMTSQANFTTPGPDA